MTEKISNILIIKHGALGDMIFAHGAFQAIRTHHRQDHLTLLTTPPYENLAKAMGIFDDIWTEKRPRPFREPVACFRLFQQLQRGKFDLVYDLQRSKRTRLYFKIMKMFFRPMPQWCGISPGCTVPYRDPEQKTLHIYDRHARLLESGGITSVPLPHVEWMNSDVSRFHLPEKFFLFIPGCSPTQMHKRWHPQNYGMVGQFLVKQGVTPVIIGRSDEKEAIETIQKICPQAMSLMNQTTLLDLAPLARKAIGALGHDTGPMHIIAVAQCPSLMLFSYSSIPQHYAPRGFKTEVIHQKNLDDISSEEIIKKVAKMLKSSTKS